MHELPHLTNEELLKRYQKADGEAFREFFERHHKLVFNYLLSRLQNRAEAEEALQKTFFRVHRYVLSYDPSQSALGWLMTITRNVAIDARRAVLEQETTEIEDDHASLRDEEAAVEARSTLEEIVRSLSIEERELLERRIIDDESYEKIAADKGLSPLSTRKRLSRLLKKLRLDFASR